MAKYLIFDTETTGLNPKKCAIHQLSATAVVTDENDMLRKKDMFDIYIKPFDDAQMEDAALIVNGVKPDFNDAKYVPEAKALKDFQAYMKQFVSPFDKKDKFHVVGFNVKFDVDFLRNLFTRCGDKYYGSWFWSNALDLMDLWGFELTDERSNMLNFQLGTVCNLLGIPVDSKQLHNSAYDTDITVKAFLMYCSKRGRM